MASCGTAAGHSFTACIDVLLLSADCGSWWFQGHIAQQRVLQVFAVYESVGIENIVKAVVEALNHAVGSGCLGLGQTVLDVQRLANSPSVNSLPLFVSSLLILMWQALCRALRNARALAALLLALMAANTHHVARSIATNG